jgi:predicted nucleic acid-binding protein
MIAYFDTSLLVGRYIAQPISSMKAIQASEEVSQIIVSDFSLLELRNAVRATCFRKEISKTELASALLAIEEDVSAGILMMTEITWPELIQTANEMAAELIVACGGRTLDLLHLAITRLASVNHFYTADQRQANCAEMVGLKVKFF